MAGSCQSRMTQSQSNTFELASVLPYSFADHMCMQGARRGGRGERGPERLAGREGGGGAAAVRVHAGCAQAGLSQGVAGLVFGSLQLPETWSGDRQ